ncbi:MAG: Asp23/Gls24 family envelope stress response protein [Actinobacteria bacterium]|nr:Asp23/Gls24 family envelope stress response protein [Actinomycetota bacterium]
MTEIGDVKIALGVLELIVGLAATEVEGVSGLSGGMIGSISDWLKQGPTKGVKINFDDSTVDIDLRLAVNYGISIPKLGKAVQENVRKAVESMTSCKVRVVNVYIDRLSGPTSS